MGMQRAKQERDGIRKGKNEKEEAKHVHLRLINIFRRYYTASNICS